MQGCTQLVFFSKSSDHIHGGVGIAVLFLHWCAVIGCILLSCAVNAASGLSPVQALSGDGPGGSSSARGRTQASGGRAGNSPTKGPKKQARQGEGARKRSRDDLDFAEENKPPKGARGMLIDKSELENEQQPQESEISETGADTN